MNDKKILKGIEKKIKNTKPTGKMENKPKITHILADGTKRDSMEGFYVPYNEKTKGFYQTLAKIIINRTKEE